MKYSLHQLVNSANTGADAIKKAPILNEKTELRCLRIGDVSQKRGFEQWGYTKTTEADYDKFKLHEGDCVIARTGNTIGVNMYIESEIDSVYNNGLIRMTANTKVIRPRFLYYIISSEGCQNFIQSIACGTSTQPNMKINDFLNYKTKVPTLDVQDKIIDIVDKIDRKFQLNIQINDNLEQQAQVIYASMFITNTNPDWRQGHLSDLITVKYGKDHKKLADGTYPVYGSGGIMRYVEHFLYDRESVLIPRKGTLNNVMYVNHPFWSVDTMFYTEMRLPNVAKYVYHLVKAKDLASMNAGSAVPSMTTDILNAMEVTIPSTSVLEDFERMVSPMYSAIQENNKQSKKLAELRDTLLPKLISGEIDVSNIQL